MCREKEKLKGTVCKEIQSVCKDSERECVCVCVEIEIECAER